MYKLNKRRLKIFVVFNKKKNGHSLQSNKIYLRIQWKYDYSFAKFQDVLNSESLEPPCVSARLPCTHCTHGSRWVRYRNTREPSARRVGTKVTPGRISQRIIARACVTTRVCVLAHRWTPGMCNTFPCVSRTWAPGVAPA